MVKTGLVADDVFMKHDMGHGHPESPQRLKAVYARLKSSGLFDKTVRLPLREVTDEELNKVHTMDHIKRIMKTAGGPLTSLDPDTRACAESAMTARLAAGSILGAVDGVLSGELQNAVTLMRPPGHHAEADRTSGFCLFNNIAVAAHYAIEKYGLKRILIVDWDVHHGNGTQHTFEDDPRVLFFSTHQYPHFPGTGRYEEIGVGRGEGYTINVPLPAGCDDGVYESIFAKILDPILESYNPELIMISAGFDAHFQDPLAGMRLTNEGYRRLISRNLLAAKKYCSGKILFHLEGGYDLKILTDNVEVMVKLCLDPPGDLEKFEEADIEPLLEHYEKILGKFWPQLKSSSFA